MESCVSGCPVPLNLVKRTSCGRSRPVRHGACTGCQRHDAFSAIVVVVACVASQIVHAVVVGRRVVNFAAQCLELRHVDGVIISSTAGHICDTAIIFSNCRIAYLVFFIANGYHTIFFCEGLIR